MKDTQEIIHLKNNLEAYKLLNHVLSKKVQDVKLQLSQNILTLQVTRNELTDERVNFAKYRHLFKIYKTKCYTFYKSVIKNLIERGLTPEMSVPNFLDNEGGEQAGPSSRVNPKIEKLEDFNEPCKQSEENNEIFLYTIEEIDESIEDRNETIEDRNETIEERNETIEERNESVRQSLIISTRNTSTCPASQDFQNITYVPTQSSPPINRQDSTNISCSSNSSTASSVDRTQDTPRISHKQDFSRPRRLSNSEDEPLPKLSIDLVKEQLRKQQLQQYKDSLEDDNESLSTAASTSSSEACVATSRMKLRKNLK